MLLKSNIISIQNSNRLKVIQSVVISKFDSVFLNLSLEGIP